MASIIPALVPKIIDAGKTAIEADLFVSRKTIPAEFKLEKKTIMVNGKKQQFVREVLVEPQRDIEYHLNGKGIGFLALGAMALGVGAVGFTIAWNGISVPNPVPIGPRELRVLKGLKEDYIARRDEKAKLKASEQKCEDQGGLFDRTTKKCVGCFKGFQPVRRADGSVECVKI